MLCNFLVQKMKIMNRKKENKRQFFGFTLTKDELSMCFWLISLSEKQITIFARCT